MPRADEHPPLVGIQRYHIIAHAPGLFPDFQPQRHQRDRDAGSPAFQLRNNIRVGHVAHKYVDIRMQFSERHDNISGQVKRQQRLGAYLCRPPRSGVSPPGKHPSRQLQHFTGVITGQTSQERQADALIPPAEQAPSQLFLQTSERRRYRGLGNLQALRRAADGARFRRGHEIFQLFQTHVPPFRPCHGFSLSV